MKKTRSERPSVSLKKRRRQDEGERQSKSETTEAAAKFMSVVSDDLLLEIILRLPDFRSVIQCATVFKRWSSLVSSRSKQDLIHQFNLYKRNNNNHSQWPFTLLNQDSYCSSDRYVERDTGIETYKLIHHGHGQPSLNLLGWPNPIIRSSFHDLLLIERTPTQYYICNPLTKQSLALPEPPTYHPQPQSLYRCALVCEPNCNQKLEDMISHYYCNCCIKYRVVLISFSRLPDSVFHASIFSSETGKWNEFEFEIPVSLSFWHCAPVGCNGVVYFTFGECEVEGIVAFDPFRGLEERCRLIVLPKEFDRGGQPDEERVRLGLVRGRLRLCQCFWDTRVQSFALKAWELVDDKCSIWVLVHHVTLKSEHQTWDLFLVALHPEDGDVFYFVREDEDDGDLHVCQYRIGGDHFEHFCEFPYGFPDSLCVFSLVHPSSPTPIPALPLQ